MSPIIAGASTIRRTQRGGSGFGAIRGIDGRAQVVDRGPVRAVDPAVDRREVAVAQRLPAVPPRGGAVARGQDVHLDVVGHGAQVAGEPVPAGDLERDDRHLPRIARRVEGLLDAPDLQDEHPPGAELDGPPERDAVARGRRRGSAGRRSATGGQQAGHRGGGEDGVDDRPAVEPVLGGVLDPGGAALERHRQVVDPLVTELRGERATQRFRGVRGGAGAGQLAQSGDGAGGEDLGGVRRAPQCFETVGDLRLPGRPRGPRR